MVPIRRAYARMRYMERDFRGKLLRRLGLHTRLWAFGLFDEYQFWERALMDGGRNWEPHTVQIRTDPDCELQEELKAVIAAPPGATVRILDVGSGPLTSVGKRWEGREVQVVPVDPLADQYNVLLKKLAIVPPAPPITAQGEKLLDKFAKDSFDLAHARNALDHSVDPLVVIRQMLEVAKPGCYVYLWHVANVADLEHHQGLHQWNFDIKGDDVILSNDKRTYSIADECRDLGTLTYERATDYDLPVVITKLKKHG